MKDKCIKLLSMLIGCFLYTCLQAQEATNASGGSAKGSGGTVQYSIGQLVYQVNDGSSGSITQGVQQPVVEIISGIEERGIELGLSAFPNPTIDFLTLKVENSKLTKLSYELYDSFGKTISTSPILNAETRLEMKPLPQAMYFVRIFDNEKTIKKFKIIKN